MQHFLQQHAKPLGRPLPQQISVNQSSCRSGRRRSAISLEAGGPGPPATARSQLHSCSIFWYLASSRLHNCAMRSPSFLLDPLWEQEVGKRKIKKAKTKQTKNKHGHSGNHQTQQHTPVSVENNRPPHLTPEMQGLFLLTKKCLFTETQTRAVFWTITHGTVQLSIPWSAVYAVCAYIVTWHFVLAFRASREKSSWCSPSFERFSGVKQKQFIYIRPEMPTFTGVMYNGQKFLQTSWKPPI